MKSRIISASVLALLLNVSAFANNLERTTELTGSKIKFYTTVNTKTISINVSNIANDIVQIILEDEQGGQLYTETVKNVAGFSKKLNLTNLDAGKYRIIIKKDLVKTIQPFELTDKGVSIYEIERKDKFIPSILQHNKKVDVNVLLGNYSNIHVKIFDNEGRLVFEDMNYVVITLNKRYDLEKLKAGVYYVEVQAGDETQNSTINIL